MPAHEGLRPCGKGHWWARLAWTSSGSLFIERHSNRQRSLSSAVGPSAGEPDCNLVRRGRRRSILPTHRRNAAAARPSTSLRPSFSPQSRRHLHQQSTGAPPTAGRPLAQRQKQPRRQKYVIPAGLCYSPAMSRRSRLRCWCQIASLAHGCLTGQRGSLDRSRRCSACRPLGRQKMQMA
jgi:hypothetical protein